jgi:hypothetical protein
MTRDEPSVPNNKEVYVDKTYHKTVTLTSGSYDMAQGAIFPVFTHKEAT